MDIICKYCGKKAHLKNVDKYRGREVSYRCLNSSCGQILKIAIPVQKNNTAIVTMPAKAESSGILILQAADGAESMRYQLGSNLTLIGRSSQNSKADLLIDNDTFVSRQHCYVEYVSKKGYLVYDNESKNGTFLNGRLLKKEDRIYLKNEDFITIGRTSLQFKNQ